MFKLKLLFLKSISLVLKALGRGTSLIGKLDIDFGWNLYQQLNLSNKKIIYVIGTNGKTTTANLIAKFAKTKYKILANSAGANMESGIATALLDNALFSKELAADLLIFEVDEKNVANVIRHLPPNDVIVTNFFRDQLDRYGEIDTIINQIIDSLDATEATIHLNGNDPLMLSRFERVHNQITMYGLGPHTKTTVDQTKIVEIKYCPKCLKILNYDYYHYAHIGHFNCECGFAEPQLSTEVLVDFSADNVQIGKHSFQFETDDYPLYFYINIAAAISILTTLNVNWFEHPNYFKEFKFPRGRNQHFSTKSKDIYFNLAKNVVGMEESIEYLNRHFEEPFDLIIAFNDNYADGRDVSWIWDTSFQVICPKLKSVHIVGTRRYDMALRFAYESYENIYVHDEISTGITTALEDTGRSVAVISNYTPLVEVDTVLQTWRKNDI
ncbi:MAG: MurT ligase domain-containing protein [Mycoplasmatales bacterium]